MSMLKAALLGAIIPAALVLPAMAQDGPPEVRRWFSRPSTSMATAR